jgi:hypothetical protein
MKDEQLYFGEKKALPSMAERVALGNRRREAFARATQRRGQPTTYGTGKSPSEQK